MEQSKFRALQVDFMMGILEELQLIRKVLEQKETEQTPVSTPKRMETPEVKVQPEVKQAPPKKPATRK